MDPLQAFRLDGRVVIVTGATSGLGVGFARAVTSVGARVVLAGRREKRLEEVARELADGGAQVRARPTDVADPDACAALVDFAVAEFGHVDGLVNNAGVGEARPAVKETPQQFRHVIDVNLNGVFWMAQACAKIMPPGSSIVNVASVLGLIAPRFPQASYAASKAGVLGLTRDLAQQWSRRRHIRVNALCPGYFLTEMTEAGADQLLENVERNSMLGRFGTQDELDPALIYLLSSASSYVTGTAMVVDGGMAALLSKHSVMEARVMEIPVEDYRRFRPQPQGRQADGLPRRLHARPRLPGRARLPRVDTGSGRGALSAAGPRGAQGTGPRTRSVEPVLAAQDRVDRRAEQPGLRPACRDHRPLVPRT